MRSFVHEDKEYYPISGWDYSILNEYGNIEKKVQEIKEEIKTKNLKHAYVRVGNMPVLVLEKEVRDELIAEKKWEKIEYLKNEKWVDINPGKVRSFVHEDKEYYPIAISDYSILNEYGNVAKKVEEVKEDVKTKNLKHAYVKSGSITILVLEKEVLEKLIAEKKWEKTEYLKNEKWVDINVGKVRSFVHEDKEYYPISISDYSILNEYVNIRSKVEEVKEDVKTKNLKHAYVKSGSMAVLILEKEVLENLIAEKKWEKKK